MSTFQNISPSAQRVQAALREAGLDSQVVELPSSTRTAKEAAQALQCEVAHIAKSLIFEGGHSHQAILVIASGTNRVDEKLLEALAGEPIQKASADFVREKTGFAIGGVSPVGHSEKPKTFLDQDLQSFPVLWAAAGTPHAVFKTTAQDLQRMTGAAFVKIC
ncbi:MAG: YbaK/EbsC family protein [Deltaproteobacteria bacterium]|nr:YbaK/EbsC family protein [Deltaproteobacteria bacterium]